MGVPLLAMPARESRADERVVGLKSIGIARAGWVALSAWWQTGEQAREGRCGTRAPAETAR